ncbi:hypothetical protein [Aeromonas salmonicida]|uniref:hypothetical protein n=1 Tax=Aeromonas salmonicida TaxID=645 RepID=UPI00138F1738|nr:hypothetical protein [Aeromonas salmonicida]
MKRFTHDADLRGMVVLRSLGFQLVPFKLHRFRKQRRWHAIPLCWPAPDGLRSAALQMSWCSSLSQLGVIRCRFGCILLANHQRDVSSLSRYLSAHCKLWRHGTLAKPDLLQRLRSLLLSGLQQ